MAAFKLALALIVVLILAQATDWAYLDRIVYALLGLLVIAWLWSRLSLGGIAVERRVSSDRCQVGQEVSEEFRLSNRSRLPKLWLELFDLSTLPGYEVSRVLHLRGRGEARWRATAICERRGRYFVGPMIVRSGDPFGLFARLLRFPERQEVLVYPATEELTSFRQPEGQLSGGAPSSRRTPTTTTSVAGLREYVAGDALNRISWTASARTGRLMVKEMDNDPSADVWLVLDLDRSVHIAAAYAADHPARREPPFPWLDTTEEYAVTVVASLARRLLESGRSVGLLATNEHRIALQPDRGDRQLIRILETLAVLHADGTHPLAEVLTEEGRRMAGPAATIVVTPSTDERWVQALVGHSGKSTRATVIIIEPDTFGPAPSALMVLSSLTAIHVPTSLVKCGDLIGPALSDVRARPAPGTVDAFARERTLG